MIKLSKVFSLNSRTGPGSLLTIFLFHTPVENLAISVRENKKEMSYVYTGEKRLDCSYLKAVSLSTEKIQENQQTIRIKEASARSLEKHQ